MEFVGRDQELALARAAVVAASGGAGRLLLVSGEPGIGKTRLVSAIRDLAGEYGVPVAAGYAIDDPGMPPLWPWLRVSRAVPALAEVLADPAAAGDSATARFAMFADAGQALADAAAGPGLLVVLEDVQWADRSSLLLLRQVAGELAHTRLLVVATHRETTAGPAQELLPELARIDRARAIRLTGLSAPDIALWLRRLGISGDAGRLLERTRGNPLFLRMLLERGIVDGGLGDFPELRQLILAQLGQLGCPARDLLGAASVLGERIDPATLAEVTGLAAAEVGALLDQAVRHGVLLSTSDTAGLSFAHAVVRDAVYEELAPSTRTALHEQAARALERSEHAGVVAGQIANHWRRSGGPGWAAHCVRWAREAGRAATAALAYDEAARFADLALRAAESSGAEPRAELALEAAWAEFLAGRLEASLGHCQHAARLAGSAGRPDLMAAAALVITGMGDPVLTAGVESLCDTAIRAVPVDATGLRARLLARQAIAAAEGGATGRARELSEQALSLAERSADPDALLDGLHARHVALCAPQTLDERRELATRACELAYRAEQPLAELWGHVWLVDAAFQAGDLASVDVELGRIERIAVNHKHNLAWWHLHRLRATRAALVGDLDAAVTLNDKAREVADHMGAVSMSGMYYAFLIKLAELRGTLDRALGEQILAVMGHVRDIPLVRVFAPQTHLLLGEYDLARATFEEFRHMPGTIEVGPRWAALIFEIGAAAVMLDDAETADRVYRELADLAPDYGGDGSGAVFLNGSTQRALGNLALASGRVDEAIGRFTDAIERNTTIGARPYVALSRLGLAKALLAKETDLRTARTLATEAAAEFRRLDMPGRLADADALLTRIDAAANSTNPLSRRESEVAALIAKAMSNRQIAQQLVLSERTVETHVRSILAKLGYSTRTEIATWSLRHQSE